MKSEIEFKPSFKYKDGQVMDLPWEVFSFGDFGIYRCEIAPLLLGNGNFRGFIRLIYTGDGHAAATDSATKETFATMKEAVEAAKAEAIAKYGPEYISQ